MNQTPNKDYEKILAAMVAAVHTVRASAVIEANQAQLVTALRGELARGSWVIDAARTLASSGVWRLLHPFQCHRLRRLLQTLKRPGADGTDERVARHQLARCASLIEFGVSVDEVWYYRLRIAKQAGGRTSQELSPLLNAATVYSSDNGKLQIEGDKWKRRPALWIAISGFGLGALFFAVLATEIAIFTEPRLSDFGVAIYFLVLCLVGLAWAGLCSWRAVPKLRQMLTDAPFSPPETTHQS